MGVPDTTTFELQDVVDEINPTTDDLVDCFADANANYFDSSYEGSKNQLLNFRNYGSGNALSSFQGSVGQNDLKFICSQSINTPYWHNGSNSAPVVGDIVYTNATGTTAFTSGTWMLTNYNFGLYLNFDGTGSQGEITGVGLCSPP
tara:strand:- start:187 stop:624 length:438 start_codon:yes stop_codon:yes gene_type:complete